MAAAPPPSLQQQLAEVEEAARRAGRPVLAQAGVMGRHDVLALLLRTAGDGVGQEERSAAFVAAAEAGHEQCLRVLLEASPSPSSTAELVQATTKGLKWSALIWTAAGGLAGCVRLLLQHSPDAQITYRAPDGWNALYFACHYGQAECVALLLQHSPGVQVAAVTDSGKTAAAVAAEDGNLFCLQLLLRHDPQQQRLDKALVCAAQQWGRLLQQQQRGGWAAYERLKPYQRGIELLLSKGAMLTAQAPVEVFALVRSVIQDLAARALESDMANEAAVQAVKEVREHKRGLAFLAGAATPPAAKAGRGSEAACMYQA